MQRRYAVLLILGSALAGSAGCGSSRPDDSDQYVDETLPRVTVEVKGMT
jgi:hypothetical protein